MIPSDRNALTWEPNEALVKVYVTRTFAAALDDFARELRLSRSLLVREAVRRGLPALVNDIRFLESKGYRPSTHLAGVAAAGDRRGRVVSTSTSLRWSKTPAGADRSSPSVPLPDLVRDAPPDAEEVEET